LFTSLPNLAVRQATRDKKDNTPHFLVVVLLWLQVTGSETKARFTFSKDYSVMDNVFSLI
jgi:hypothetical protein